MSMNSEPGNTGAGAHQVGEGRTEQPRPPGWLLPVKIASVVMGIMIIVGVIVLVVTVAGRIGGSGERNVASGESASSSTPQPDARPQPVVLPGPGAGPGSASGALSDFVRTRPAAFGDVAVDLPSGVEVISVTLGGDRMAIRTRMPDRSERILVFSLVDGAQLGLVTVRAR